MLKKLFEKDGIIMVFNDNQTIDECYFIINNYDKDKVKDDKDEKEKKTYYITKGFTYPQIN
tara:strand:- start:380 stop:562 length:183 start_codon:yes stop_codon:yes gene_type:complete